MNNSTWLQPLQQQTETMLTQAIAQWQVLPHSVFAQAPQANSWSANECLQHLNSYGDYYLPAIEKALQQRSTPSTHPFKPGWLGGWFTRMMQTNPTGLPAKKMKAPKQHAPIALQPSHEVIARFIDQQEHLLQLLQQAEKANLSHIKVPISIAPMMKLQLGDVLAFLVAHNHRHVQQAQRALQAAAVLQA